MNNLYWAKESGKYYLKNEDEVLVELYTNRSGKSFFKIDQRQYTVERKGFWSAHYYVFEAEKDVLKVIHNFWGSNGKIILNDGTFYNSIYTNRNGIVEMSFTDRDNHILSFRTFILNKKREIHFSLGIAMIDADSLLLLSALGMLLFHTLFNEDSNDDSAFISPITAINSTF